MVTWYWTTEYLKVLAGYGFLTFIWPSVVLRRYLKGRSTTFWFGFCVTFQPVLVNTVVLLLGLCHLLNIWVIRGLFYIPFLIEVAKWLGWGRKEGRNLKHLLNGTYGVKMMCHNVLRGMGRRLKGFWHMFRVRLYGHWWEYGLLSVIIIYGMIYFAWGVLQTYSFGSGDMYLHNAWIYNMVQGKVFTSGVYPEGMHCFIYGLHALFGVRIYSCQLFLQPVHVAVILLSVYVLLKQVFRWKYTPMFVLAAFLTVDVVTANTVVSMSRLQWTLPQEFGFPSIFLCAAFLVRYLNTEKRMAFRGKLTKGFWDENLLIFALSLAESLTIHFYPTIMAFFLCLAFVPVHLRKIFSRKRFVPLVTAVAGGVMAAVLPMAVALATGMHFQGSINWAMSVIQGSHNDTQQDTSQQGAAQPGGADTDQGAAAPGGTAQGGATQGTTVPGTTGEASGGAVSGEGIPGETVSGGGNGEGSILPEPKREPLTRRLKELYQRLREAALEKGRIIYRSGYVQLFQEERARLALGVSLLAVLIWICYRIPAGILKFLLRRKKRKPRPEYFDEYFSVVLASFFFMVLFSGPSLGLPELIETYRICALEQLLVLIVAGVPVDLVFTVLHLMMGEGILKVVSAGAVAGIYVATVVTGHFHGYLMGYLTRLNSAVLTTHSITETMPPYSFTIVSPTDELYQQIQYGWHEELSGFVNKVQEEEYTLPTEHIFIFVEKRPFRYAQYHFAAGPEWLAQEKYMENFNPQSSSRYPEYVGAELMPEEFFDGTKYVFQLDSSTYSILDVRVMVETLACKWCREFAALYPGELQTYYEDENFVCYYIRQNPQRLYQLGILYREEEEPN